MARRADNPLYFIAIVPGERLRQKVNDIKEALFLNYHTKAALRSPPHITIHMPFNWRADRQNRLIKGVDALASQLRPFEIRLSGFGSFPPRVIFIHVIECDSLLNIHKRMMEMSARKWRLLERIETRPFKPHMTVAFRDLKKPLFHEAWACYEDQDFDESFIASSIVILKHNGSRWEEFYEAEFGSGSSTT